MGFENAAFFFFWEFFPSCLFDASLVNLGVRISLALPTKARIYSL
jgi:hypothetical protein